MSPLLPPSPEDFGQALKAQRCFPRFRALFGVYLPQLGHLELTVLLDYQEPGHNRIFARIYCVHTLDYTLRPRRLNGIEGGPLVQYHETHPRLDAIRESTVFEETPDQFPPLTWRKIKPTLLELEDSYVIAERFGIRWLEGKLIGNEFKPKPDREGGF